MIELGKTPITDVVERARLQYLVGEAQLVLERPAEAETSFRDVIRTRPKAVPALVGLGRALRLQGQLEAAEKPLKEALALDAEDVGARIALGELRTSQGELEAGEKLLAAAHASAPADPVGARSYFEVLLRREKSMQAVELAEAYMQLRPEHPLGSFLLAVAMERDGADEAAQEQYLAALELDPGFIDAHKNLAILCHTLSKNYSDKARVELAFQHYKAYFELGGGDQNLRATYEQLLTSREQLLGS